jgi:putative SOS response-associated peptidase YedK
MNNGSLHLDMLRWGLIPSWSKEENIGSRMINARAETLAEKPSFKRLLHSKRCLVVTDGFYEWRQESGTKSKTPMYMTLKSKEPFAFAGLWDSWRSPDGQQIRTCTIITTEPNELLATIHNRMPAILTPEARDAWLDPALNDEHALVSMLVPYKSDEMEARPVSRLINDPRSTYNPLAD